jgi:hypothetical protein
MRTRLALVVTFALAAAPAQAGDLTGTWKGKFACTMQSAQGKQKSSSRGVSTPEPGVSTLEVSHPDGPGTPTLQVRIDGVLYAGFVIGPPAAAAGAGAFFDCTVTTDPGGFGEIRNFKWKATPDDVKGSISWRSLLVDDDAVVGSCKGKWRRISREDPGVASCR